MMRSLVSVGVAFGLFAGSFVLHIVGGATDQGWLFAVAVALIYLTAAGFPAIAGRIAGRADVVTFGLGVVAGVALTSGALWAANDRSWALWTVPLSVVLTLVTSAILWRLRLPGRGAVSSRGAA
ncbi:MAG: hypothetical protein ACSLFM_12425 [Tepidiformaceae bacterium]